METPQLLDISAEITTFFGIFFAIFSSLMNIFNLKKIEKLVFFEVVISINLIFQEKEK